jgi:hypothetical protein
VLRKVSVLRKRALQRGEKVNEEFRKLVDQLPGLLERLGSSPALDRSKSRRLPKRGVYVFYEGAKPVYVGRSNRMKERILEHGRPSSDHYSATFAFRLAKESAKQKGIDLSKTSAQLEEDPAFVELFSQARQRVSEMSARAVEIKDPIVQTLFEVYAHIALRTEHNDFDTH